MRKVFFIIFCFVTIAINSQNITVDSQTYSPQELIENILIDSDCITNVQVTNVIGGNFNNSDQSYGYFNGNGSTFPFQSGIVLSTGRLSNVPGPNTSLSDDNATNWIGDSELEVALQESNTINATIIEFDFTSITEEISFRYIFASEEYQEGNSNTCNFSDLFGFLIRPQNSQQYENIALVPNTQTPVKVTTVHSGIPGSCNPINETYFESWNNSNAPINFNGQTTILTATAQTTPNQNYHVKLVIADEQNYRYDSAVFLEAGSFKSTINLGQDRLLATNNPVCENDTVMLNAFQNNATNYKWFRNGTELTTQNNAILDVVENGIYNVEVTLSGNCISYGEIVIEYSPIPVIQNSILTTCDINQDEISIFNLYNANQITSNNNLNLIGFYTTITNAEQQINAINQPEAFENTIPMQTIYAVLQSNETQCYTITEITLNTNTNSLNFNDYNTCDDDEIIDGFTTINLDDVRNQIAPFAPVNASFQFYNTLNNAYTETDALPTNFTNTTANSQTLYIRVSTNNEPCYAIAEIALNVLPKPQLLPNQSFLYCINSYPETIFITSGLINNTTNNYTYKWFLNGEDIGINTPTININQTGILTVNVTHANGCVSTRDITIYPSNKPTIENVSYTELTQNNTATITVSGEGDYEYAINNEFGFYQDENTFTNLKPGFHTIYVRDKMGCGSQSTSFAILGFPNYFTPNNDNINDTWKPIGTNYNFNTQLEIFIFNRYGKLLAEINPIIGWNGKVNNINLPSDDYWYIINHPNGKQYKGHFALVR